MARLSLRLFDVQQRSSKQGMPLIHIADAAVASQFPSREALEKWLAVAIGEHYQHLLRAARHARRAVQLCPLLGEGYISLAELAFLEGLGKDAQRACIEQALKVRPYSVEVAFAAGREAVMAGDVEAAFRHFQFAFERDRYYQTQVIQSFGEQPAEFFVQYFRPDLDSLGLLFAHYKRQGMQEDMRKIGLQQAKLLQERVAGETGETAADTWLEVQQVYASLGERPTALAAAQRAAAVAPEYYKARRSLATALLGEQRADEAIQHLQWCLLRYPDSEALKKELANAQLLAARAAQTTIANRY
jgi:tetratricopeptide (TPR) repeat protein